MAAITHQLNVTTRTLLGTKVKQLRNAGLIPSNIYGKGLESRSVSVNARDLTKMYSEVGESALVEINLDGKEKFPILFKNPAFDVMEGNLIHVDMYKVDMKQKITTNVPIVLTGVAPAIKQGFLLMEVTAEVEIECLPSDLPESIEVDLSKLEKMDDMITIGDLKLGDKIEILSENETVIAKVIEAQQAEVVEEATVAPAEVEVITAKKPEEEATGKKESEAK